MWPYYKNLKKISTNWCRTLFIHIRWKWKQDFWQMWIKLFERKTSEGGGRIWKIDQMLRKPLDSLPGRDFSSFPFTKETGAPILHSPSQTTIKKMWPCASGKYIINYWIVSVRSTMYYQKILNTTYQTLQKVDDDYRQNLHGFLIWIREDLSNSRILYLII